MEMSTIEIREMRPMKECVEEKIVKEIKQYYDEVLRGGRYSAFEVRNQFSFLILPHINLMNQLNVKVMERLMNECILETINLLYPRDDDDINQSFEQNCDSQRKTIDYENYKSGRNYMNYILNLTKQYMHLFESEQ